MNTLHAWKEHRKIIFAIYKLSCRVVFACKKYVLYSIFVNLCAKIVICEIYIYANTHIISMQEGTRILLTL